MIEGGVKVAVGRGVWHDQFAAALDRRIREGADVEYAIVDIDAHDWQTRIAPYDLVIWKGRFMGAEMANHYREKIYFMERFLDKVVVPGFESVWHFESKIAQSYIFAKLGIPTPDTVVSFDYADACDCLAEARFPLVAKKSLGAGSSNVEMVPDRRSAEKRLASIFWRSLWSRHMIGHAGMLSRVTTGVTRGWFWRGVLDRLVPRPHAEVAYWQEFIPDNRADLRVTVIGHGTAVGFWRRNRPGDFRASGSGLIDYATKVPEEAVLMCMNISRQLGFDSMAYDLLVSGHGFVVVEMSYGYLDSAVFRAGGHYVRSESGELQYQTGQMMPQEFWLDWALQKYARKAG